MKSRAFSGLDGTALKWLAVLSMTLDHMGIALAGQAPRLEEMAIQAGRPAFIIFSFLLAEGFVHTRDRKRYLLRLLLLGAVSEIPYDLALWGSPVFMPRQNVFWTLAIGLAVLWLSSMAWGKGQFWEDMALAWAAFLGSIIAWILRTDYDVMGVLLIVWFFWSRDSRGRQMAGALVIFLMFVSQELLLATSLSLVFIWMYSGQRGRNPHPMFFYWFYPVHLAVLAGIRFMILK
ncbi:MAG TPA: conjugal transfer protein TraX [Candidatus Enterocloster faecavium]|uniref:Conjugal transfer protein TraX n=1 Tax=Candidatus Enterocloster faecavium TaxID=2838560 RepID=A0A9D2L708_9FIRM|nr:conjugal transfer protein TraX [Candidatus Enterocloster faecavium]